MAINAENTRKFADAFYGPGAVIDGTLLQKLMEILQGLIGGCPFGSRRAHTLVNGGKVQQRLARRRIRLAVEGYVPDLWFAEEFAAAAVQVGRDSTVEEFEEFVKS